MGNAGDKQQEAIMSCGIQSGVPARSSVSAIDISIGSIKEKLLKMFAIVLEMLRLSSFDATCQHDKKAIGNKSLRKLLD